MTMLQRKATNRQARLSVGDFFSTSFAWLSARFVLPDAEVRQVVQHTKNHAVEGARQAHLRCPRLPPAGPPQVDKAQSSQADAVERVFAPAGRMRPLFLSTKNNGARGPRHHTIRIMYLYAIRTRKHPTRTLGAMRNTEVGTKDLSKMRSA